MMYRLYYEIRISHTYTSHARTYLEKKCEKIRKQENEKV